MISWIGVRQSVLAAVFLAYLINFTMQWIARKTQDEQISIRIRQCHSQVFLFGLISLMSCNLLQGGVYQALIVWAVLISLLITHILNFKVVEPRTRAISGLVFYIMLFAQCLGTVIHYIA